MNLCPVCRKAKDPAVFIHPLCEPAREGDPKTALANLVVAGMVTPESMVEQLGMTS